MMRSGMKSSSKNKQIIPKGTVKKLLRLLKPHSLALIFAGLLSLIYSILAVLGPYLLGLLTQSVVDGYSKHIELNVAYKPADINVFNFFNLTFVQLVLVVITLYLVSFIIKFIMETLIYMKMTRIDYELRTKVFNKITRLKFDYIDKFKHGEILNYATNDINRMTESFAGIVFELLSSVMFGLAIIVIMFVINYILAFVVLALMIVSLLTLPILVTRSKKYYANLAKKTGNLNGHIEEMFIANQVVKAFNYEVRAERDFNEINDSLALNSYKSQFITGLMWPIQIFLSNVTLVIIAVIGAVMVLNNLLAIGMIQTFVQYSKQLSQPIQSMGLVMSSFQQALISSSRVFGLLEAPEVVHEDSDFKFGEIKGEVEFVNCNFSYDKKVPVITNFNAKIKPGQMVAIVGPTGAGKTTLVNLLMRFYDLDSGKILIDGFDISKIKKEEVRNQFGMVLQDTWLFEGTIKENISYGNSNTSISEIKKIAKEASIDHFVESLPKGYDFMLDEEGLNISQGERQLTTIARTMLADKPMLILDEATSSVDTRTEVRIKEAMEKLANGRTSFIIAHRLSTIKSADLILVLDKGNIVEQGNHEELLNLKGYYYNLYNSQFMEG